MKLVDWAKKQGITYRTAWQWHKDGKLPVKSVVTPTGTILVEIDEKPPSSKTAIYARVSSHDKKEDLKRQVERIRLFCLNKGWEIDQEVTEIASGLNDNRKKLIALLKKKPNRIVVEYKDRLTRFGFNYLDQLLPELGTELVVINRDAVEENDLVKDLIAIVTSFCCRLYGARRGKNKADKVKETLSEKND